MGVILPVAFVVAAWVGACIAVLTAIELTIIITVIIAVVAVAAAAAATYFYIQGDYRNSMLFSAIAIAAGVGSIYIYYAETTATYMTYMTGYVADAQAGAAMAQSSAVMQIATAAHNVYNIWVAFADMVQLKLLWQIHQIAYLVSQDYRDMMNWVFKQVSQVSINLGFGAMTLNLLFENIRTSVFDISTTMGQSYDLAQIKWMSTYNELLKQFSRGAQQYAERPNDFLMWIADNTFRPGYNAKAATMRMIMESVESALALVKSTAESATKIRNDLMKLIGDLPEVLRKEIMPKLSKVVKDFDDFMKLNYNPTMLSIDKAFAIIGKDIDAQKEKTGELVGRLKRPGKYLTEIDMLEEHERVEDEDSIGEIATRSDGRKADETSRVLADSYTYMFEEMTPEGIIQIPLFERPIEKRPSEPTEDKLVEKRVTPFVGDY